MFSQNIYYIAQAKEQSKTPQQIKLSVHHGVVFVEAFTPLSIKEELATTINNSPKPLNSIKELLKPSPKELLVPESQKQSHPKSPQRHTNNFPYLRYLIQAQI